MKTSIHILRNGRRILKAGNRFISDMIITAAASAGLTVLGMLFRVYISNEVGAAGMGLYQLIYTLYLPACTVAASGINLAAVRMISDDEAKNADGSSSIMKCCFLYSLFFGLLAALLLFFLSEPAGVYLIKNEKAALCLKILSFGLPFLAAANAVNGYFTAKRKILRTVIVQIAEDITKIAVTVTLLVLFRGQPTETLCMTLVAGSAVGETFACAVSILFYLLEKKKKPASGNTFPSEKPSLKPFFTTLFKIAIPTAISSYVRSGLSAVENMLVPYGYRKYGYSEEETLSHIGVFRGMVIPLIMFPSTLLGAAAKLLVPEISYAYAQQDMKRIERIAVKAIYSTLLFSFFIAGAFLFFAKELCFLLYKNEEAGIILMLLSALVPIMYLDGIVDAILKGINEQIAAMRYSIIDSVISVALILLLLPRLGLRGYIVVTYISCSANSFLGISRFLKVTEIKFSVYNCVIVPFLSAAAALLPVFVFGLVSDISLPLIVDIAVSALLYVFFVWLTKTRNPEPKEKLSELFERFPRKPQALSPAERGVKR